MTTRTSVISLGEALSDEANITLTCALVQRGRQGWENTQILVSNTRKRTFLSSSGVILHQDAIQTQVSLSHRKTVTDHVIELWPGLVQHQAVFDILFVVLILAFSSMGNIKFLAAD